MGQMIAGDVCVFYTQKSGKPNAFYWAGVVSGKARSPELSRDIWGTPDFEHVYFLGSTWPIELTLQQYSAATGYDAGAPRGIFRANAQVTQKIELSFGSLEQWARSLKTSAAENRNPPPVETIQPTPRSTADQLIARISASGFHFTPTTIRAFHASLRAKPFVILAGNSGTGKSRLVRLYAECYGATEKNRGFHMIPVRPDWNDGSDLIGYTDLENHFRPGRLVEPLLRAHANPDRPFFVCLDEMNLARVEHYFSDFLSIIESRRKDGAVITTDAFLRHEQLAKLPIEDLSGDLHGFVQKARNERRDLGLPTNLFIVGTVNMDETTQPFSRKVLDRANTIELNAVDLRQGLDAPPAVAVTGEFTLVDLQPQFVRFSDLLPMHRSTAEKVITLLERMNTILSEAGMEVGYRVRDEAAIFLVHAREAGLSDTEAEACVILQKILPRVHGSSPRLERVLEKLLADSVGPGAPNSQDETLAAALQQIRREHASPVARKVAGMWLLFRDENFTSFWIA